MRQNRASADQHQANFGFDIGQIIGNPPWRVRMPIENRRMAGDKIAVNPQGRSPT